LPALPKEQSPPSKPSEQVPAVSLKTIPYSAQPVLPSASALRKSIEQPSATTKAKPQPHLQVPSKTSRRKTLPAVANITREMRETSPPISESSVTSSTSSSSRWPLKKLSKRPQPVQPAPEPVYTVQAFRSPSEQMRIPGMYSLCFEFAHYHVLRLLLVGEIAKFHPNTLVSTLCGSSSATGTKSRRFPCCIIPKHNF
jgi:hypothetical protein